MTDLLRPSQVAGAWLNELADYATLQGDAEVMVHGVSLSTDRIQPGDLYAALPGSRAHGAAYACKALDAGAVAVLTDAAGVSILQGSGRPLPTLLVTEQPRRVLGEISAAIYGHPATRLRMIGVTGTQGKTTTTRLLEMALTGAGVKAGAIGTVGTLINGDELQTRLTTPEAPDLQALFAVMHERGVQTCAMEVSSHALAMGRVGGVRFDVATFLNLGRDHLDFHDSVEDYFAVKASLFVEQSCRLALINVDDEWGRRLLELVRAARGVQEIRTFSIEDSRADWSVRDLRVRPAGSSFVVVGPDGASAATEITLAGAYNVSNALAAVASAVEAGHPLADVASGLAVAAGVPGRLERVALGQPFEVVVDYAHKPDAVEAAITALRPLLDEGCRLITVLGAGGDRDPGKRPVMGEIAARLSDHLVVTDDNPRSEDPATIRAAVLSGVAPADLAKVSELGERREAISAALQLAQAGDIVLIAGKGHETGQEIAGVVHPFDDREVARRWLRSAGFGIAQ